MRRSARTVVLGAGLLAPGIAHAETDPARLRELAQKVLVAADPGAVLGYNQGTGPYGPSTVTLFDRPSAFSPGDKVRLAFRLPRDTRFEPAVELRAGFALHDLDGKKVADAGEAALRADGATVEGTLEWTVPEA